MMNSNDEKRPLPTNVTGNWRVRSATAPVAEPVAAEEKTAFDGALGLRIVENMLGEFIDGLDAAIFITDVRGQIVMQNTAADRFGGDASEPVPGVHIADVLYTPLNNGLRNMDSTLRNIVAEGHGSRRLGLPIALKNGDLALIDYDLRPLLSADGELIGGVVIATELSPADNI